MRKWIRYGIAGSVKMGKEVHAALDFKRYMSEAGYMDIIEEKVFVPM